MEHLGNRTDDNFRLWFTDHANHADYVNPGDPTHVVSYLGVLQQALRDLSAWVENDATPPANTNYEIVDGQVIVPTTALERAGIQPIVRLNANGNNLAEVGIGKQVKFPAAIEVPPHAGEVISAEWDFQGDGSFPVQGQLVPDDNNPSRVTLNTTHAYAKPGTYFVTLRVSSQREGDAETPYTKIQNLGRARVVVK